MCAVPQIVSVEHGTDRVELQGRAGDPGHACVSVGRREPDQARAEAAGEACHGQQPESSQPFAKRLSFGMSWHVVLATTGAVLNEPSGRIRSPALVRATGRQSRSA